MRSKTVLLLLVFATAFVLPVIAQEHNVDVTVDVDDEGHKKVFVKKLGGGGLDLTDEQKEKARDLKLEGQKELLPLENELRVKKLDLKIAMKDLDKVNLGKVNSIVDEIHKLNAEIQKKKIAQKLKFREILTDEQKKKFDAGAGKKEHEIRIMRRHMLDGPGGEKMMWFGTDDEEIEMLHDMDIEIEHESVVPAPKVRIEKKHKL